MKATKVIEQLKMQVTSSNPNEELNGTYEIINYLIAKTVPSTGKKYMHLNKCFH